MAIENPKYDVAISFLSKDEPTASAIYQKLTEGLNVFFFPRNQEELAGTDGLESMRKPFFDDSRVMVVLYQEPWGKTPWTRVEETAIKEACLQHGWERLFFMVLNQKDKIPVWLPTNHVRFNYADYGLEQAVGAIKARVQDNGGQNRPLTALKRAELLQAAESFRHDQAQMGSGQGIATIVRNVGELFQQIKNRCDEINTHGSSTIRCGIDFQERNAYQRCIMTDGRVSVAVVWNQQWTNSLSNSGLFIREYRGGLTLPHEAGRIYARDPTMLNDEKYVPDLSLSREYGWKQEGGSDFLSSSALAEKSVIRMLDLIDRKARGELDEDDY
jgi:hypothetical protein